MILHGHQLAANHHYALNLICQQCNELRHHSDVLLEEIRKKCVRLQKTLDLLTTLQQVTPCSAPVVGLRALRPSPTRESVLFALRRSQGCGSESTSLSISAFIFKAKILALMNCLGG